MSLANLLVPNDYKLYIGSLNTNTINMGITGAVISELFTDYIDTPPGGGAFLDIGPTNATTIFIGSGVHPGTVNINPGNTFSFPVDVGGNSYRFSDSGAELLIQLASYTGTFSQPNIACKLVLRRIGNWVDLYFNPLGFTVGSGATFNNALTLAGIIPVGYRPANSLTTASQVTSSGVLTSGQVAIDTSGNISFAFVSTNPPSFTGGNYPVGPGTISVSYTII